MRFVEGKQYMVQVPGSQRAYRTTYLGASEGDYNCSICGKDGWGKGKWSARHEFVEGDPDNPKWVFRFGTECIRKVKIAPADGASEDRMGTMKDVFESSRLGATPNSFWRVTKSQADGPLRDAQRSLEALSRTVQAGNDFDMERLSEIIEKLTIVRQKSRSFDSPDEVKGTPFEW